MNKPNSHWQRAIDRAYRPDESSGDMDGNYQKTIAGRVRHIMVRRTLATLAVVGIAATMTWNWEWTAHRSSVPLASAEQAQGIPRAADEAKEVHWEATLTEAWHDAVETYSFTQLDVPSLDSELSDFDLPNSMVVVAGIVDLTVMKEGNP